MGFKNLNGVDVPLTDEEQAELDALIAASQAKAPQKLQSTIVTAVQERLDDFAKAVWKDANGVTHGDYDNVNSISKYQNISDAEIDALPESDRAMVLVFRTDCRYLAVAAAQTWSRLWAILATVQAGDWPTAGASQVPTGYADIESELPVLGWPV